MTELREHKAYRMLEENYRQCLLDYVILYFEKAYEGEHSHKEAVLEAFRLINERDRDGNHYWLDLSVMPDRMSASRCPMDEFLKLPEDPYYETKPAGSRGYAIPSPLPYWFAFLDPPYSNPYVTEDFKKLNGVLFPFPESLEIYRWNDDFSNYFDDGKEWWGTGCWSAYDRITGIYVVIGASLTD